jgi:hypothetical protein
MDTDLARVECEDHRRDVRRDASRRIEAFAVS